MKNVLVVFCIFVLVLMLSITYVEVGAVDNTFAVTTPEEFKDALATIHEDSNKEYIIRIENDLVIDTLPHSIDNGNRVTIIGNNHSIQLNGNKKIVVTGGAELNLSSTNNNTTLSIMGPGESINSDTSLVMINNGIVNMYNGVSLSDNYSGGTALTGAAIRLGTNGIFNMYGGTIHDTKCSVAEVGAAVTLDEIGAVFNMYGGEIFNNYSGGWGGAVYVSCNGEVNITGGSIYNNTAYIGAGVAIAEGNANIKNTVFRNNEAEIHPVMQKSYGGTILNNDNCSLNLNGCTISNSTGYYGGAIMNYGNAKIENCVIEGCEGLLGGAIANQTAQLEIKNSIIDGNTASNYGGAILNLNGSVLVSQNNIIKNNQATYGGGIFNYAAGDVITSENDVITANTANSGAGVYINKGSANFSTTKVYNNKAINSANDFYISSSSGNNVSIIDPTTIGETVDFDGQISNINGWYKDESGNRFALDNLTEDVSYDSIANGTSYYLTAGGELSYKVEFDTDGGNSIDKQIIVSGGKATRPSVNPTKEGFDFDNWYTDNTYSTVFDFDTSITANTVVYARWIEDSTQINYEVIEGANQEYVIGNDSNAVFKINANYSVFISGGQVYVDDVLVEPSNYESVDDYTKIIFKKEYLESLSNGEHTLRVAFGDGGNASTKFTVKKEEKSDNGSSIKSNSGNPKTGDNGIDIYVLLMLVSIIGIYWTDKKTRGRK